MLAELPAVADSLILVINRADQVESSQWSELHSHVQRKLAKHGISIPSDRIVFVSATAPGAAWDARRRALRDRVQAHLFERCGAQRARTLHHHVTTCVRRLRTEAQHRVAHLQELLEMFDQLEVNEQRTRVRHENAQREIEIETGKLERDPTLAAQVVAAFKDAIPGFLAHLEARASSWTSARSPVFRPRRHVRDITQQATRDLSDVIRRWAEAQLPALVQEELRARLADMATGLAATLEILQRARGLEPEALIRDLSASLATRLSEHVAMSGALGVGGIFFRAGASGVLSTAVSYVVADGILFYLLGAIGSFFAWPLLAATGVLSAGIFAGKGDGWARIWVRDKVLELIKQRLTAPEIRAKLTASITDAVNEVRRNTAKALRDTLSNMLDELRYHHHRAYRDLQDRQTELGTSEAIRAERDRISHAAGEIHLALDEFERAASIEPR